jgi:hypothetical protein
VSGSILYNGHNKDEFVVERTTAFVDQVRPQTHHVLDFCIWHLPQAAEWHLLTTNPLHAKREQLPCHIVSCYVGTARRNLCCAFAAVLCCCSTTTTSPT